jgi:hypothetical protein
MPIGQIVVRKDTAANWTSNNPTLASGELGFETDSKRWKIGDGSTAYNSLTPHTSVVVADYKSASISSTQSNVINYTPPSIAGHYRMSITIHNTSGTNTGSFTPSVTYHSAAAVATTFAPNFMQTGSATLVLASTGASLSFSSVFDFDIDASGTAITLTLTASGTAAAYANATLEQIS